MKCRRTDDSFCFVDDMNRHQVQIFHQISHALTDKIEKILLTENSIEFFRG